MIRKTAALAALWLFPFATQALDSVALEVGRGEDRTDLLRVAAQDRWNSVLRQWDEWRLTGYWDFMVGVWDNQFATTTDIGVTPVFSFERGAFYIEAAIGAHLVERRISERRNFSSAFQFGDHIGIGMRGRDYDYGIAFQHLSNGGVRRPNPGINFLLVRLQYHLR